MSPELTKMVKERAKELKKFVAGPGYNVEFKKLAKHVIASEIRARIDEHKTFHDCIGENVMYPNCTRIESLLAQLAEIGEI